MRVVILLATYNGERFLATQLASIAAQSHDDWLLLARDDGSCDASASLLADFARNDPARVRLVPGDTRCGARAAFAALLDYAMARESELMPDCANGAACSNYALAFADQDDLWHRDRLAAAVSRLQAEQAALGDTQHAILVYNEMRLIDAGGRLLAERFSDFQGFQLRANAFPQLLAANVVSGCGALLSASLARRCTPLPAEAVMHDWWAALIASLCGRLCVIEQPLVDYRQHASNAIGARHRARSTAKLTLLASADYHAACVATARQARYLSSHSPRPLSGRERLACWLASLLRVRSAPLRLALLRALRLLAALERAAKAANT